MAFVLAWLLLTLALFQNWEDLDQAIKWLNSQLSLAVIVGLLQTSITIAVWYRVGGIDVKMENEKYYNKKEFERVDKEKTSHDRRIHSNHVAVSELRGEVEIIKSILFENKDGKDKK